MCSTIGPGPGAYCFSFFQVRHFWKARTDCSHLDFVLRYLLTPALRYGGPKGTCLSAQVQGPMVLVSCKQGNFAMPQSLAFTEAFVLGYLLTAARRSQGCEHAQLFRGPLFQFPASKAFSENSDKWL